MCYMQTDGIKIYKHFPTIIRSVFYGWIGLRWQRSQRVNNIHTICTWTLLCDVDPEKIFCRKLATAALRVPCISTKQPINRGYTQVYMFVTKQHYHNLYNYQQKHYCEQKIWASNLYIAAYKWDMQTFPTLIIAGCQVPFHL